MLYSQKVLIPELKKIKEKCIFQRQMVLIKKESQYYPPTKSIVYVRMYMDGNDPIKYEEIR
jgi:hypothetical protein